MGDYYLYFKEETRGPFTLNDMRIMFRMWQVPKDTPYWTEGLVDWEPMSSITALLLVPPEPQVRSPDAPPETDQEKWQRERDEASWRREKLLLDRYGETEIGRKIINRELWIGETEAQLMDSHGYPDGGTDDDVSEKRTRSVWKYYGNGANRFGLKVTLVNGVVKSWKDKG